jgi:hypothetical protein
VVFGFVANAKTLGGDNVVQYMAYLDVVRRWYLEDMYSGLIAFNDLLDIGANGNKMDVMFVFINVVAEYLLTLFIHCVNVVNDDEFFLAVYGGAGLAECLHIIAEILDSLFFDVVDEEEVVFR